MAERRAGLAGEHQAVPDGRVALRCDLGGTVETFVEAGGKQIVAVSMPNARPDVSVGQSVGVQLNPGDCVVLKS